MSTTTTTPTVATSGKLDTTKTPDMLKSSRSKTPEKEKTGLSRGVTFLASPTKLSRNLKPEREKSLQQILKAVSIDNKLENRLTMKDLAKLQKAFMTEGDGYDNKLALYRDMFCEALSILLDKGTREEYGELFDKVDVAKEGTVDWDKFASHMLLEFYERDDRVKSTQVPQWKDLKMLQTPHKDIVQRVQYLKSSNRYVSISKEGTVGIWGPDLKLSRSFRIATDSCKARDLWVTHFVALQNINKIAVAFTSKEIAIYDMGNKLEFNCQYKVQGMEFTPLCLDYWYNPKDANEAILCWGDVGGFVNCLFFNSANIALFERPPAPAGEKQEPCLNVNLQDVGNETLFKNETYTRHEAHRKEWVRQVKYAHYLECFISCSTTSTNSMVIGWMEKKTGATTKDQGTSKKIQRVSNFNISQGVNTFDYNQHLNIIATAGVNHHVCLWNPHIVSKPNGVLRGHMASVIQVQFIKSRGQLISFSKDKVLRIWDVQLQVCIQRLAGMFPKGPEVVSTLFFDEERDRSGMERNKMLITFNYQITLMEMKTENRDKIMSHDKPVTAAIYNSVFNQVISVCQAGTLIVWMIDTGQKVKQFNNTHANAEVTCLAQDPTETKLFTGSTDGTVKVWDFNGHCFHTLECAGGQPADVGQILNLKRSVVVVGWTKQITVFPTASFKDFHVQPAEWKGGKEHSEDILCCAFTGPNHLATGSYDGEIVIWNTNSEHISRRLNQRSRRLLVKSRQKSFMQARKESANSQRSVSKASQKSGKSQTSGAEDTNEFGLAIAKLIFLDTRKGNSAGGGANLISGGGNGWVRFWNTSHSKLIGEFVAHQQSGSILMATDKKNRYMATGDVDGVIKVWDISEYCVQASEDVITTAPPMKCQFQAHSDMINTLEMCERNERVLVISASSDCSVAMYDVLGNMIGIFGQEEHWKIEHYDSAEEMVEESESEQQAVPEEEIEESKDYEVEEVVEEDNWEPDERAITDPEGFRINTWDNTLLGKNYQELRVQKRERKQPSTIPDLPYLHWERTGHAPAGPYSSLDTQVIQDFDPPKKPNMSYTETVSQASNLPKLPNLVDTLKQPVPEKEIFPKYILDFEAKMKDYHRRQLSQGNSNNAPGLLGLKGKLGAGMAKSSLQSIGLQLGKQVLNVPSKPTKSVKSMKVRSVSRRTSIVSTEASQAY
ncbi:LOW QUALITY PROTEIN: cilia- and flagella-associated protein 337 [Magallana gigas]|uniref:LOW QUALITY PROTEIN: cilia- and flagella-associated protein 337 n=1 Tax=Magallana gigas TaxID=29159 RepID=UPI00333E7842